MDCAKSPTPPDAAAVAPASHCLPDMSASSASEARSRLQPLDIALKRHRRFQSLRRAVLGLSVGATVAVPLWQLTVLGQQSSGLVTVLSTLAIAALFNPLRHRIQNIIDRRFFRRKYDAGKALARFGQALRDDTSGDLDAINADLIRVVEETLEPASISLWVRPATGTERA